MCLPCAILCNLGWLISSTYHKGFTHMATWIIAIWLFISTTGFVSLAFAWALESDLRKYLDKWHYCYGLLYASWSTLRRWFWSAYNIRTRKMVDTQSIQGMTRSITIVDKDPAVQNIAPQNTTRGFSFEPDTVPVLCNGRILLIPRSIN